MNTLDICSGLETRIVYYYVKIVDMSVIWRRILCKYTTNNA